jgi:hypothetical protein
LLLLNTQSPRAPLCELDFASAIVHVLMNRRRLVVVLENRLHLFDLGGAALQRLQAIDTPRIRHARTQNSTTTNVV